MDTPQFQERMQRIEELIAAIQDHGNSVVRASAVEMVRALLDIHRAGLTELLENLGRRGESGQTVLNELLQNDLVSRLLLLHGLHPVDLRTRVQQALDHAGPWLRMRGAYVQLVQATHDVVELRVHGGSEEVHRLLEEAILAAAPDVLRLEFVAGDAAATRMMPLPIVTHR